MVKEKQIWVFKKYNQHLIVQHEISKFMTLTSRSQMRVKVVMHRREMEQPNRNLYNYALKNSTLFNCVFGHVRIEINFVEREYCD